MADDDCICIVVEANANGPTVQFVDKMANGPYSINMFDSESLVIVVNLKVLSRSVQSGNYIKNNISTDIATVASVAVKGLTPRTERLATGRIPDIKLCSKCEIRALQVNHIAVCYDGNND